MHQETQQKIWQRQDHFIWFLRRQMFHAGSFERYRARGGAKSWMNCLHTRAHAPTCICICPCTLLMSGVRGWVLETSVKATCASNTHNTCTLNAIVLADSMLYRTSGRMLKWRLSYNLFWLPVSHVAHVSRKWRNHAPLVHTHSAHWVKLLISHSLSGHFDSSAANAVRAVWVSDLSCRGSEPLASARPCTWSPSKRQLS